MRLKEAGYLLARLARGFGHLGARGPEDGPPALVIPGFIANDRTTMELRRALAEAGWRVHGWALGWNLGVEADMLQQLEKCVDRMGAKRPVLVVGWSLGGLYARELARQCPEKVRAVVTLGSPFSGDLHQNNVWRLYEMIAGHKVNETPVERILEKPPVPSLAVWSRKDGIVAPRAARGLDGERDVTARIDCAHMAFGVSRKATRQVVREIDSFVKKYAPIQ
ncbi:MAG TPA: alpha/beta fold hydrolase [Sphingomicrobium sp.]|jgi:pimeloyl-ACP methyl ester carboxylesterase|nr:alpha/beta fold hydrolase [Sphingomicrobium sp.]